MASIDMFCAADDEHRVVLLVDLLQRAGQSVVLRAGPVAAPTNPCLVACTRRALGEPWVNELFAGELDVVAVRLDATPLPQPCARVIDMQNWPARSADRKVAALVGWLLRHGPRGAPVELAAAPDPRNRAEATAATRGRRPRRRASDGLRALLVVALLGLGGGLLWLSAPDPAQRSHDDDAPDPAATDPAPGFAGPAADGPTGRADPAAGVAADGPGRPSTDGVDAGGAAGASLAVAAPDSSAPASAGPDSAAPDSTAPDRAVPDGADALAHLCNARSAAAARAWAATLNWRQRRRLPDEPCVARLLARPGFESLSDLL